MEQTSKNRNRSRIGRALGTAAAAVLCLTAFGQLNLAYSEPHGFHGGGGFHAAFGEIHGGGFHDGRIHNGRFFGGGGWSGYYPYDGGYYYDDAQPSYSHYCADPAGYYPFVTQCSVSWQAVPAS
jgi:hypothetical protein